MKKIAFIVFLSIAIIVEITACENKDETEFTYEYGVFNGAGNDNLNRFDDYRQIVIDAQDFTTEDIQTLHEKGHMVYSYINLGSLEQWRDYYDDYSELSLGVYEGWEDECWVNVADARWQNKQEELATELIDKGVDGLFVDNIDVYEYVVDKNASSNKLNISEDDIYDGITKILTDYRGMVKTGTSTPIDVILNGGTRYVEKYRKTNGTASAIMTGINQESVFSEDFTTAEVEATKEYQRALEDAKEDGMKVYMIEYTKDDKLISQIKAYCRKHDFYYYIANSLNLE